MGSRTSQTSTAWAGIVTQPAARATRERVLGPKRQPLGQSQTSTAWAVPNVNRLGRYCHSHCLDRHCHRSNEWAMSKISTGPKRQPLRQGLPLASLVSQTSTAWAGIVSQVAAMGPSASAVSQTSTAWAGIVTCDGAIFGIAVRPKRQPLGQVLSRSRSHSARPVPNVNRLGRYCHSYQLFSCHFAHLPQQFRPHTSNGLLFEGLVPFATPLAPAPGNLNRLVPNVNR